MTTIMIGQVECRVDEADVGLVSGYRWRHLKIKGRAGYAACKRRGVEILMHRLIMAPPDDLEVDHIDRDGLNNVRSNLRLATHAQNKYNTGPIRWPGKSSEFVGVSYERWSGRWKASIKVLGRKVTLGRYQSEEEAARAYDAAALERDPVFAHLNFPV